MHTEEGMLRLTAGGALPLSLDKEATELSARNLKSTQPTLSKRTGRVPGQSPAPQETPRKRHTESPGKRHWDEPQHS
jgi:hypothetical protein